MKLLQTLPLLILMLIPKEVQAKSHALGFAAGSTYGIGLSYSHDWNHNGNSFGGECDACTGEGIPQL